MPKVSIIIPCYNHGLYINEAISSIEAYPIQSKYEIIIVNDGSTDLNTLNKLRQLENLGYCVIHQRNKGLGAARNRGIDIAKGKYILPLDSDNKIYPNYMEKSIKVLEEDSKIGVVYGNANFFGNKKGIWKNIKFNFDLLFLSNYIDACAVFRKKIWEDIGGYDENMPVMGSEDWDFWMRTAMRGWEFHHIDEILFDYRVREDSMLRTSTHKNSKRIENYIFSKPAYKIIKPFRELRFNIESRKWLFKQLIKKIINP